MSELYSYSRLNSFENCPCQYKYYYIDKIRPEEEGIEAFVGSRAHAALEELYARRTNGELMDKQALLEYYQEDWRKEYHAKVKVVRGSVEGFRRIGAEALADYHDRFYPFDQGKVLGLEKRVVFSLDRGKGYQMQGYIDRLVLNGDCYEIHDYKTSAHLPTQEQADADEQLALYQLAVQQMWQDVRKVKLVWHYLRHNKSIESARSAGELKELAARKMRLIDRIRAAEEFPPRESALCRWCNYQQLCPAKAHGRKLVTLPENEYLKEKGKELVDKYAEFQAAERRLKTEAEGMAREREKIRQAIANYARKHKYAAVEGTLTRAEIREGEEVKLPGKNDERREELEGKLRKRPGGRVYFTLDNHALARAIKDEMVSGAIARTVEPYVERVKTTKVSFKKRRDEEE